MTESTWDQRERRILNAIDNAFENGEDLNFAARSAVPDLSDRLRRETIASLIDNHFLRGQVKRDGSNEIFHLVIEGRGSRGHQAAGRWPAGGDNVTADDPAPDRSGGAGEDKRKWVFLVAGRNNAAVEAMTQLLLSAGLRVVEWGQAREATNKTNPYIGEILTAGMDMAQGVLVLFTPDDMAVLDRRFWREDDPAHEHHLSPRARQNVVFEAGMALGRDENRVVMVECGTLPGFSDLAGRHAVRMDDSASSRKDMLDRLVTAHCDVDFSGSRWMKAGDFTAALTSSAENSFQAAPADNSVGSAPGAAKADRSPGRRRMSSPLNMLQPNSFLDSGPTGHADFLIRCAVLLPDALSRPATTGETFSTIRGEERESAIADLLTQSEVTEWLERQRGSFHLTDLGVWSPHGVNLADFSHLVRAPACESAGPSPVALTCDVTTGGVTEVRNAGTRAAIEMVLDVRYRLLGLDENRAKYFTEGEDGEHARLTIKEVFDALVAGMSVCNLALAAFGLTMPAAVLPVDGELACWVTARNDLDQIVDVAGTKLIPGSATNVQYGDFLGLPLERSSEPMAALDARRITARAFIAEWLERSGRRHASELLSQLDVESD